MRGTIEPEFKGPRPQDMSSIFGRYLFSPQGSVAKSQRLAAFSPCTFDQVGYHNIIRPSQLQNPRGPYSPSGEELRRLAENVEAMNRA